MFTKKPGDIQISNFHEIQNALGEPIWNDFQKPQVNIDVKNKVYMRSRNTLRNFQLSLDIWVCSGLLGLLLTLDPVFDLPIDMRLLKIIPNYSPYPKTQGLTPKSSLQLHIRIIDTISLLAEGLGLLQPVHPVLYSQISLRVLKMVPNDLSFAKQLQ